MAHDPTCPPAAKTTSSISTTSAVAFTDESSFVDFLLSSFSQAQENQDIIINDVPPSWAYTIFSTTDERVASRKCYNTKTRTLRVRIRPTWVHDSVQEWMRKQITQWYRNGDLTDQEDSILHMGSGTTIRFTEGPYKGSVKEPDVFLQVGDQRLPTVAIESGWTESKNMLNDDMNLLLVGGNGSIKVVFIVKWTLLQHGRVSASAELFCRNRDGIPRLRQSEVIFPPPSPTPNSQQFVLYRCEVFGDALPRGLNPQDELRMEIADLRNHARRSLSFMGLTPAVPA